MEKQQVIYYVFCVLVLCNPVHQNIYSTIIKNITYLLTFPQFYLFRAYLASGPPAAKTVFHGLLTSFTYVLQLVAGYVFIITTFGYFTEQVKSLILTNPQLFCELTTPRPLKIVCVLYLMYLAFFRLLMVVKMEMFMNLNHEAVSTRLDVLSVIITVADTTVGLLYKGTTCNVKSAAVTFQLMGAKVDIVKFTQSVTEEPMSFMLVCLIISVAIVCYILSYLLFVTKRFGSRTEEIWANCFRIRCKGVQVTPVNEIELEEQITSRPTEDRKVANQVALPPVEVIGSSSSPTVAVGDSVITSTGNELQLNSCQDVTPMPQLIQVSPVQFKTSTNNLVWVDEAKSRTQSNSRVKVDRLKSTLQSQLTSRETVDELQTAREVEDDKSQLPAPQLQSTIGVSGDKAKLPTKTPKTATGVSSGGPAPPSASPQPGEVIMLRPPRVVLMNPILEPPPEDTSSMTKLFQKVPFSAGFVVFIFVFTIAVMDSKSYFYEVIVDKVFKYLLGCLPMYWILRVDDCYRISLRRTKTWFADHLQIYFD